MLQTTIEALLVLASAWLAWTFLCDAVPRLGRHAALCLLHNSRDDLTRLGAKAPQFTDSLVYSDMVYITTTLIHIVRDMPQGLATPVLGDFLLGTLRRRPNHTPSWRTRRYADERARFCQTPEGAAQLRAALDLFDMKQVALAIYVMSSNPVPFLLTPLVIVCGAVAWLIRRSRAAIKTPDCTTVEDTFLTLKRNSQRLEASTAKC